MKRSKLLRFLPTKEKKNVYLKNCALNFHFCFVCEVYCALQLEYSVSSISTQANNKARIHTNA